MSLLIRAARPGDVPRIAIIARESRSVAMPWLPVLHSPDEDLEFFGRVISAQTAFVAELDGRVAGFAVVDHDDHMLEHLYLDPLLRRRGIGTALVAHVRAAHPEALQLWVFADNHEARAFYAALGAVELYATDGIGNEERTPDVRLELAALTLRGSGQPQ